MPPRVSAAKGSAGSIAPIGLRPRVALRASRAAAVLELPAGDFQILPVPLGGPRRPRGGSLVRQPVQPGPRKVVPTHRGRAETAPPEVSET